MTVDVDTPLITGTYELAFTFRNRSQRLQIGQSVTLIEGVRDLLLVANLVVMYERDPDQHVVDRLIRGSQEADAIELSRISYNSPLEVIMIINAGVGTLSFAAFQAVRFFREVQSLKREKAETDLAVRAFKMIAHSLDEQTLQTEKSPEYVHDRIGSATDALLQLSKVQITEKI